ncbi:MAG TPA: aminomethyl-transferring glycine dehydrogenase subunit GcvPA, partial [Leptospiraceae bacterium]|nr:aminomethyl-transferring glycine dehydrogenase subunit GcvPA [Leptospiraceae bacterium]
MKPISENNEQRLNISADFADRHNGSQGDRLQKMLNAVGYSSLEKMISDIVPENIRLTKDLDLPAALHEEKVLKLLEEISSKNKVFRNYIGLGFHETHLPKVILRNVLENPGWYTAYTPYQAEIAQGRLEALLNFQTMITDLTGMEIANASLLDESTAAAEAVNMFYHQREENGRKVFLSDKCHPYTIDVVKTRCAPLGILTETGSIHSFIPSKEYFAAVIQYPDTDGKIEDIEDIIKKSHDAGVRTAVAADIMSLVLLKPPGEFGADAVVGSTQRFGLPLGFGGPHAGYFATKDEFKRNMPGRLVGVSKDSSGRPAFRLSLQTREQHIRRDKATSNICTAQVLLAVLSSFYAVYHGPNGLKRKAERIHSLASALNSALKEAGHEQLNESFFDTLKVRLKGTDVSDVRKKAETEKLNFRYFEDGCIGISIPETAEEEDLNEILSVLSTKAIKIQYNENRNIPDQLKRTSAFLTHPVFNSWHSETEMMR